MEGARVRIKCPQCGLVQWKSEACLRCNFSFAEPQAAAAPIPAAAPQGQDMQGQDRPGQDWQAPADQGQIFAQQPAAADPGQVFAQPPPPAADPGQVFAQPPPPAETGQVWAQPAQAPGVPDIYAPPEADLAPGGFPGAAIGKFGTITEEIVGSLESSSRWMNYSAIFGYLMAFFYAAAAVLVFAVAPQVEETGAPLFGVFLVYFLFAGIAFMVSHHLRGASKKAKAIREAADPGMFVADTLQHQYYVWRTTGILSAVGLFFFSLALLFLIGALLTGIAS